MATDNCHQGNTRKVLISTGFGAGWSTWIGDTREHKEFALFDAPLIAAVEAGGDIGEAVADFERRFKERFPGEDPYLGGARGLKVAEVEGQFIVEEYDGAESLRFRETEDWF